MPGKPMKKLEALASETDIRLREIRGGRDGEGNYVATAVVQRGQVTRKITNTDNDAAEAVDGLADVAREVFAGKL